MALSSRVEDVIVLLDLSSILLSLAACLFALVIYPHRHRSKQHLRYNKHRLYADKDGESTGESSAHFLNNATGTDFIICTTFGLFVTIARSVYTVLVLYRWSLEQWLQIGAWALLLSQCVILRLEIITPQHYYLGLLISTSTTPLSLALGWRGFHDVKAFLQGDLSASVFCAFDVAASMPCTLITILGLCLQRRPDVYWKNRLVDRQFTASALSR